MHIECDSFQHLDVLISTLYGYRLWWRQGYLWQDMYYSTLLYTILKLYECKKHCCTCQVLLAMNTSSIFTRFAKNYMKSPFASYFNWVIIFSKNCCNLLTFLTKSNANITQLRYSWLQGWTTEIFCYYKTYQQYVMVKQWPRQADPWQSF